MINGYIRNSAQGGRIHGRCSIMEPSHILPPHAGAGLVQLRAKHCTPDPQVTEQLVSGS